MCNSIGRRVFCAVVLLSVSLSLSGPALADDQSDPRMVLAKAIKAMGGEATLAKFKAASWKFTSKGHGPEGIATSVGECFRQGGDQYNCNWEWQFGDRRLQFAEVINGKQGWIHTPTGTRSIAKEEEFTETKSERLYLRWITTLVPLKHKDFKLAPGGELRIGDRTTVGVLVSREGYRDAFLSFDKETGLLVKADIPIKVQRGSEPDIGKVLLQEHHYSNYKEAKGCRYAGRIVTKLDGKLQTEVQITEFTPYQMLDDSTFAKP